MLKKTLENHRKIDKKSMKKPAVFLIDFLIDFWTVFRKVLGHVLALKFDEKCIEKLMKIFKIVGGFLMKNQLQIYAKSDGFFLNVFH